jgi:hypothetical protein
MPRLLFLISRSGEDYSNNPGQGRGKAVAARATQTGKGEVGGWTGARIAAK